MKKYNVTGMACGHCKARVENAIAALEGVESVTVSLEDKTAEVEGEVSDETVIAAVKAVGFEAEAE